MLSKYRYIIGLLQPNCTAICMKGWQCLCSCTCSNSAGSFPLLSHNMSQVGPIGVNINARDEDSDSSVCLIDNASNASCRWAGIMEYICIVTLDVY